MSCICEPLCNGLGKFVGWVADEVKAIHKGTGDLCERVGLPRNTVSAALVSFVASAALAGTFALLAGATLSSIPTMMLTAGTVAAVASLLFALSVSFIRHGFNTNDMHWAWQILLSAVVLVSSAIIVSTFLPFHINIIAVVIFAVIAVGINYAMHGWPGKYPLNRSAIFLV